MTITDERTQQTHPEPEHTARSGRSPFVWTTALLVALVLGALAGWAIRGDNGSSANDVPDEVAALIDDWYAANERADGSVLDLYLPTGYHLYGDERIPFSAIPDHLGGNPALDHEWITEPVLITTDGNGNYLVVRGMRISNESTGWEASSGLVFEIETIDDGNLGLVHTAWIER